MRLVFLVALHSGAQYYGPKGGNGEGVSTRDVSEEEVRGTKERCVAREGFRRNEIWLWNLGVY
jgi:hypothetical protein